MSTLLIVLTKAAGEVGCTYCSFAEGGYLAGPEPEELAAVPPSDIVDLLLAPLADGHPPGQRPGVLISAVEDGRQSVLLVAERRDEGWFDLTIPFEQEPCAWTDVRDGVIDLLGRLALGSSHSASKGVPS